jgi:DNA modification methylase
MTWQLIAADCVEAMRGMEPASVDAVVTDPPYGLEFMGKEWDRLGRFDARDKAEKSASLNRDNAPIGTSPTYIGGRVAQEWHAAWATEALRVLKPGGHLLSFGGTRTYHRLVCALEDAGFEIRDCLAYLYGSGFPKSLNVSKDQRFCQGHEGDLEHGESTAERDLRSMRDADVPAAVDASDQRREVLLEGVPQSSASATGRTQLPAAEVRLGQSRLEGWGDPLQEARSLPGGSVRSSTGVGTADGAEGRLHHGAPAGDRGPGGTAPEPNGGREPRRPQPSEQRPSQPGALADEPGPQDGRAWPLCPRCSQPLVPRGLGTALKPAFEPIVLARKPLSGTVAQNVLEYGTGALNVDGTRIGTADGHGGGARATSGFVDGYEHDGFTPSQVGRWPANVLLDADAAAALDEQSGEVSYNPPATWRSSDRRDEANTYGLPHDAGSVRGGFGDRGGASRFFYTAKTSRAERENGVRQYMPDKAEAPLNWSSGEQSPGTFQAEGTNRAARNHHPTVKPVDLMQWLCRLITPPKGLILDPFTGSGSTGIAALREGFSFIGIEREPEYVEA